MTKYYDNRNYGYRYTERDTPIVASGDYEQMDSRKEHYCPYCQLKLSRLMDSSGQNPSLYCSKCIIEYPDKSEVKSKSHLSTPQKSNNENPAVAYPPEPGLRRKKNEPRGTFKLLQDRGEKISNYHEHGWRKEKQND